MNYSLIQCKDGAQKRLGGCSSTNKAGAVDVLRDMATFLKGKEIPLDDDGYFKDNDGTVFVVAGTVNVPV